jgi:hypothetical protein
MTDDTCKNDINKNDINKNDTYDQDSWRNTLDDKWKLLLHQIENERSTEKNKMILYLAFLLDKNQKDLERWSEFESWIDEQLDKNPNGQLEAVEQGFLHRVRNQINLIFMNDRLNHFSLPFKKIMMG